MTRFGVLGVPEVTGRAQCLATYWDTFEGRRIEIRKMHDDHLENALRMIVRMEARKDPLTDHHVLASRDPRGPGLLAEWQRRWRTGYPNKIVTPTPQEFDFS